MTIMEKHANLATQAGAYSAVYGGFTANEIAAYGGLLIGLLGLVMNWYYKAKEDRRAEQHLLNRRATDAPED